MALELYVAAQRLRNDFAYLLYKLEFSCLALHVR